MTLHSILVKSILADNAVLMVFFVAFTFHSG